MTTTTAVPFKDVLTSLEELREIKGQPSAGVIAKEIPLLDEHCRMWIGMSPFVLVGSSDMSGRCDVSPRGGPPGFVRVLDEHRVAFADLPGNRRVDTMHNLVQNPNIGLLFLIPGIDETLRVNGRAWPTRDPDILDLVTLMDRRPPLAVGVEVKEVFVHCAKAFRRGQLWQPTKWPDHSTLPSAGCILKAHAGRTIDVPQSVEEIDEGLERNYREALY
jgi:uncharacterized protein